jgi:hypothetical protein
MKRKAIIVDIDGTLADNSHRKDLAIQKNFEEFTRQSGADEPFQWALDIVNMGLSKGWTILLVTGRSDKFASLTTLWLQEKCGFTGDTDFRLFMRKEGDNREDTIIKAEVFENEIKDNFEVLFAMDDRTRIVKMWRSKGIITLQGADGDF